MWCPHRLVLLYGTRVLYNDIIWASWDLKSPTNQKLGQQLVQANKKKNNQKYELVALCEGNQLMTVDSSHKGSVMWKAFPLHDVIGKSQHSPWKPGLLMPTFSSTLSVLGTPKVVAMTTYDKCGIKVTLCFQWCCPSIYMMTSSNGNMFRIIGPLWREFTGHRWIPLTKASEAELWCILWSTPKQTFE